MKLCLIGSSRFLDLYQEWNRRLTLAGHVIYTIAMVSTSERGMDGPNIPEEEKETLDLVHLLKIQESDGVFLITDKTGYVGFSTKREIKWARMLRKGRYWCLSESDTSFLLGKYQGDPEEGWPV